MLPRNGRFQLLVHSITYPATSGDTAAASADPTFIRPLAEPEYRGAMSMGMAQKGPMVNSAKKNAAARQEATKFSWCDLTKGDTEASQSALRTGSINAKESRKQTTMILRRALLRSPVRRRIESLVSPPIVLPIAPRIYTPLAEMAAFFRFSLYVCRKNDGSQVRKSHSVQP